MTAITPIRDRITELRRVKASELLANPRNWRKHPQAQSAALSAVLHEVGYADALLARETPHGLELIDGHLRQKLTPDQDVPVLVLDVTEEEANKILLTLDPLAALAESDKQALDTLLRDVSTGDAALQEMLSELASDNGLTYNTQEPMPAPEPEIDRAAELQAKWGTEMGQLWQIGRHRLLCGDSTKAEDVARVMGRRKADAVVTDPPYGVGINYESFVDTEQNAALTANDFMPTILALGCPIALTPGVPVMWDYPQPDWVMCWIHPAATSSSAWGFAGVNPILVYGKDPYLRSGKGRRHDHIVLAADREGVKGHPVPKPPKVWTWLVERLSVNEGELIFDPFIGSGTTLVVCEQLARICYGIEIEPKYVAVTLERLSQMNLEPRLVNG